jgi:hypothetical protein
LFGLSLEWVARRRIAVEKQEWEVVTLSVPSFHLWSFVTKG